MFVMIRQTRWQIRLTPEWKKNVSTANRRYETGFPVSLRLIGWSLLLDKTTGVSWFWPAVCLYWQCEIVSMIRLLSDILEDASRTRTTRLIGWLLFLDKTARQVELGLILTICAVSVGVTMWDICNEKVTVRYVKRWFKKEIDQSY